MRRATAYKEDSSKVSGGQDARFRKTECKRQEGQICVSADRNFPVIKTGAE